MDKILHQLVGGLSQYYGVSSIPSGGGFRPSTVLFLAFVLQRRLIFNPKKEGTPRRIEKGYLLGQFESHILLRGLLFHDV